MKKTYVIEVDCANCANKMEDAVRKTPGIAEAVVNFMGQKLTVEFAPDADPAAVMKEAIRRCKKVDSDLEIYL